MTLALGHMGLGLFIILLIIAFLIDKLKRNDNKII